MRTIVYQGPPISGNYRVGHRDQGVRSSIYGMLRPTRLRNGDADAASLHTCGPQLGCC